MKKFETTVSESIQETPSVKLVRLTWPDVESFNFRPGQWVGVCCLDFLEEGKSRPLRRAFSIASSPGEKYLELCIERGLALSAHLQDISVGSKVLIDGPFGIFSLKQSDKHLFIAGGTGIAPFIPMIDQALAQDQEVILLYSIKTKQDFIYQKKLQSINNPKFKLVVTLTREEDSDFEHGRVQTFLDKYFKPDYVAYLCGSKGFIEEVRAKLVELGQPEKQISIDAWD